VDDSCPCPIGVRVAPPRRTRENAGIVDRRTSAIWNSGIGYRDPAAAAGFSGGFTRLFMFPSP
jgi:hypothetical protein